jgi:hypothetical protein
LAASQEGLGSIVINQLLPLPLPLILHINIRKQSENAFSLLRDLVFCSDVKA